MTQVPPTNPREPGDVLWNRGDTRQVNPVSNATHWRHVKQGILPAPTVINGRNYWWRSEYMAALRSQATQ